LHFSPTSCYLAASAQTSKRNTLDSAFGYPRAVHVSHARREKAFRINAATRYLLAEYAEPVAASKAKRAKASA